MPLGAFRLNSLAKTVAPAGVSDPTGGVRFESANTEYMNITSLGSLPADNSIYHGSVWFKFDSLPTGSDYMMIGAWSNSQDNNYPYYLGYFNNNGSPFLRVNGHRRTSNTFFTYSVTLSTDTWYHVIFKNSVDGSTNRELWLDGTQVVDTASPTYTNPFPMDNTNSFGSIEQFTIASITNNNTSFAGLFDGCIEQYYWHAGDIDISSNLSKFYDNGFVDMGTDGTSSGLAQPDFFHQGNDSATFDNLGGTVTGTMNVNGTISGCS